MGDRVDSLKSLLHRAARAGTGRLANLGPVAGARHAIDELKQRRATLTEASLSRAFAHAPGVAASVVGVRDGWVRADLTFDDGRHLALGVAPETVRFAPRGAKEVIFSVEPPELVEDGRVRDLIGSLAAAIARAVWGPVLGPARGEELALVEREGARLRADLRTVPAVRAALEGGPLAMALEMLTIEAFAVEDRAVRMRIGLPLR
jgi:hypothetical protein